MRKNLVTLLAIAALATSGCHKKPPVQSAPLASLQPAATPRTTDDVVRHGLPAPGEGQQLATAYFALDSWTISEAARTVLDTDAAAIRTTPDTHIRIEGYADERGSTQYNVALGQRRAESVRTYLETLGVSAERIETVSYGKERPADPRHDEQAWSANRRAELVVVPGVLRSSSR